MALYHCFHHQFYIRENDHQKELQISPHAFESCMEPEKFHITPILIEFTKENITFSLSNRQYCFSKKSIKEGNIHIQMLPFKPQLIRKKNGCNPCTNCGQCSW